MTTRWSVEAMRALGVQLLRSTDMWHPFDLQGGKLCRCPGTKTIPVKQKGVRISVSAMCRYARAILKVRECEARYEARREADRMRLANIIREELKP